MTTKPIYQVEIKECGVWFETVDEPETLKEAIQIASFIAKGIPDDRIRISTPDHQIL